MNSINDIDEDDSMLYASFNQDNSFFSVGTERGFKIYQTFPFRDHYERIMNGGVYVIAEMSANHGGVLWKPPYRLSEKRPRQVLTV